MATQRIESGRVQISAPGNVPMRQVEQPGINYVGGQAQAQTSSALAQTLDRMSNVLFEQAQRKAVEEAKIDYFNQFRPDDSQISLAAEYLKDPRISQEQRAAVLQPLTQDERLRGGSIYAQTLRKLRSNDLAGRFEMHADNEFAKVLTDIENNRMTSRQAADKMSSVVTGMSRAVGAMDAEAAIKFQNTMGMRASVIMAKSYDLESKRQREVDTAQLRMALDNDIARLPVTLEEVTYVNAAGEVRPRTDHVQLTIRNIYERVTPRLGLAEAERMVTEYRKKAQEAVINVISSHVTDTEFAPNALSAIAKLDKNDAGKMTPLWAGLDFADRAKIRQNLRTIQAERQTAADQADKDTLKTDSVRVAELTAEFFKTGNKKPLDELRGISVRNPKAITPEAVYELPKKLQEGETRNPRAEFILKTEIFDGIHTTHASLEARAKTLGIGYKSLSEHIFPIWTNRDDKSEQQVEKMFRTASKIVPGQSNISQRQNEAYASMTAKYQRIYKETVAAAIRDGKPLPTKEQVAQSIINGRQNSAQTDIIENNLRLLNEQYGPQGTLHKTGIVFTEETDINDLSSRAAALGLKPEHLSTIRSRMGLIDNARSRRDAE